MSKETEEYDEQFLLEDAFDDAVQDVYNVFRPTIGDCKMDNHYWGWRTDRHVQLAVWLRMLATRVESHGPRKGRV